MKDLQRVLKKPCLTEKSNLLHEQQETVAFKVDPQANKVEIKKAVEDMFQVKVARVRTTKVLGKKRRVGVKSVGRSNDWKKAYVTLAEGKINFLDEL
ncbi:MAG: 50S ribosomal protein L23 [Desulfobulbus sp.]|nr:MAG: 50S ribosomal protein L23 [Desulfobulbus sp.]